MNRRTMLLLVVSVAVALAAGVTWLGRSSEPASAQGPPNVVEADSGCILEGYGPHDFVFFFGSDRPWDAAWIDLSLQDNGFASGTFLSAGPFAAEHSPGALPGRRYNNIFVWTDLKPGLTHYFRVNLRYGNQWYPSPTHSFYVPFACYVPSAPLPASSPDVSDLEQRLDTLEDCLDIGAVWPKAPGPFESCGNIEDLYKELGYLKGRVNDLEERVDKLERGW